MTEFIYDTTIITEILKNCFVFSACCGFACGTAFNLSGYGISQVLKIFEVLVDI